MPNTLPLQEEVDQLWSRADSEEQFYSEVEELWGLVPSVARQYLVGLNEYSVYFPAVVTNPTQEEYTEVDFS